jgi:hypothetical protein
MVIVDDVFNNYEASTLRIVSREYNRLLQITPHHYHYEAFTLQTLSSEYNRMLHITPIISNLHKMGGK